LYEEHFEKPSSAQTNWEYGRQLIPLDREFRLDIERQFHLPVRYNFTCCYLGRTIPES
jgi:hypothetical protein